MFTNRLLQNKEKVTEKNAGPRGTEEPSMPKSVSVSQRKAEGKEFRVQYIRQYLFFGDDNLFNVRLLKNGP